MRKVLLLLVGFVMLGCSEQEKEFSKVELLTLTPNSEYTLGKGVFLKTKYVIDMRKPIGSKVDWRGDAKLRIQLYTGKRTVDTVIATIFPNELLLDGYRIRLVSIYPYPQLNKTRHQKDYSIRVAWDKRK